ncbi:protease SohB [Acinetobacter rathckeae]|uniref:protease SohB n=1 Tax=Acinetobacter rathckeae TaxID=2605272 RepID=UPI0018A3123E|nr:protease SohB [Acinetobacter rathckeae]MBF7686915.1 protease SohB [Acinetobacter rathckeae]MBF7694681.1 protease SohB [Acinetobacter rathckeae]
MLFQLPKLPAEIHVTHLNERLETQKKKIKVVKPEQKFSVLGLIKAKKSAGKKSKERIFVLDFKGDVQASAVASFREEITLIIATATAGKDRVLIRLESPGGVVHGYGLAAAQIARLRDAGFHVTVCVDKVAASGGYMMACVANEVVASPFSIIGSIGVVAQIPNFNRLLKEKNVDFEQYTAGEYKRTVTMFGENTDEGKAKFKQELQETHELFKLFVEKYRPQLNVEHVATGEHWYGEQALALNLVDQLQTSDTVLLNLMSEHDVYLVSTRSKPTLGEKLGLQAVQVADELVPAVLNKLVDGLIKHHHSKF